jgi:hypothetical protein
LLNKVAVSDFSQLLMVAVSDFFQLLMVAVSDFYQLLMVAVSDSSAGIGGPSRFRAAG